MTLARIRVQDFATRENKFSTHSRIKSYKDRLNRSTKPVVGIVKIFTLVKQNEAFVIGKFL